MPHIFRGPIILFSQAWNEAVGGTVEDTEIMSSVLTSVAFRS